VQGLAALVVRERLGWSTPEAWIADLVVTAGARRLGVGTALVRACTEFAKVRGCRVLRLECGSQRRDAHAFYERLGFRPFGVDLRLPLE